MIIIKDLWKSFGAVEVLKGLNLEVQNGETLVIFGRSGVGKSVLLRQILGIELPDRGFVEVNGMRISEMNQRDRYRAVKSMGMLFQGAALFDSMNVGDNVAFYLKQNEQELASKEIDDRVANALELVGLAGAQSKMPSDLSGGMRKRVALARLIIYRPKIVLYDEPTTGLDPITAHQISQLIVVAQKELQATVVVVTHDIKSAMEIGKRFAFHSNGIILDTGTKDEFFKTKNPTIREFIDNAVLTNSDFKANQ